MKRLLRQGSQWLKKLSLAVIAAYQFILSPWIGNQCRHHPTCSAYAQEAIEKHGAGKGGWLALKRIFRCHPFGGKGYDPVP